MFNGMCLIKIIIVGALLAKAHCVLMLTPPQHHVSISAMGIFLSLAAA